MLYKITVKGGHIMGIVIREALAKDAGQLIRHLKEIGGESDNLSFGEGEF